MLSPALGPPPLFIDSEKVMATPKLSAFADITVGPVLSVAELVVKVEVKF